MTTPDTRTAEGDLLARYSRQILYPEIGEEGQRRLLASRVTLIGCGALGTVLAETLVRAGVGYLRLCDRDYIERNNLQRQVLFDEDDLAANLPKAEAAARKLRRINPDVTVDPVVTDVHHKNITRLAADADLLLDGTDNFETRFLINDLAVKTSRPWIYGAVIGATGLCMPVIPQETPCLRCVFEQAPPPDMNPTCDTAGVLAPAVHVVAAVQAIETMKILADRSDAVNRNLISIDVWAGRVTHLDVRGSLDSGQCPCCKHHRYDYLDGKAGSSTVTLCGRNAVQINPTHDARVDFDAIAKKLEAVADGPVTHNAFLVRAAIGPHDVTVFADGRVILKGTSDPDAARTLYAKYVGA